MTLLGRKQLLGFGLDFASALALTAIGCVAATIAHPTLPMTILEIVGLATAVMAVMAAYSRTFNRMADYWDAENRVLNEQSRLPKRAMSTMPRDFPVSNPTSNPASATKAVSAT